MLIMAMVILLCVTGCQKTEEVVEESVATAEVVAEPTEEPTEEPTPTPEPVDYVVATETTNLLTGEETLTAEAYGKRPVAVSVSNIKAALPQYGVSAADIIYEIPVEGNITRLMAVYGDYTQVPDICSVRSCRYYYPMIAEGLDAYFFHSGMDNTIAGPLLTSLGIETYDNTPSSLFVRDSERQETYALEHTMSFLGTKLVEALENSDIRTDLDEEFVDETAFLFSQETITPTGDECTFVSVGFNNASYYSDFTYNEETGTYFKDHSGSPHIDSATGLQLEFTNVIIMETSITPHEDSTGGHQNVQIVNENAKGYLVTNGAMEEITWTKADEYSEIVYYNLDGEEIAINTGKTYVAVTYADCVTFS